MNKPILILAIFVLLFCTAGGLFAATDTHDLQVNCVIGSWAWLSISETAINFYDDDPETVPSIEADENPVSVTVKARTGSSSTVTLIHLAGGDLAGGGTTIGIENVTWTGTGTGFEMTGTMDDTTAQPVGSWTGPGSHTGSLNYFFANSWDYVPATYTQATTFTLTVP